MSFEYGPEYFEVDLNIYRGGTFDFPFQFQDEDTGDIIPLDNAEVYMEIRDKFSGGVLLYSTSTEDNPPGFTIEQDQNGDDFARLVIPAETTAGFEFKCGVYDVFITQDGETYLPYLKGGVNVEQAATELEYS